MSQVSSASSRNGARRRRPRRPAKHSLNGILRQHAGASLFVRPICWTDMHSRLLGAHFHELSPCSLPLPKTLPGSPPSKGHLAPSRAITTLSESLTEILLPDALHPILSSNAVKTVLSTLWPVAFSQSCLLPELHMFFGDRVYREAVRTQVMWTYPGDSMRSSQSSFRSTTTRPADSYKSSTSTPTPHNPANLPMMCYIGKNQLASMRKNLFRIAVGPGKSWNGPVFRLQQLRSKALVPANSDHDAHFVAIFIAMAQRHFYGAPVPSGRRDSQWSPSRGRPERPPFEDITLRILTHDNDPEEFIVYTGHVSACFLDRFHDPSRTPMCDDDGASGIKIEYTRIPIWPILGLRERLGIALGEEIVGQFDPSEMETWETDVNSTRSKDSKRKRDALSEVFNGSFDEDTDSDEQRSPVSVKRRRLPKGSPVGVVV
ncbi:hypothetical protein QQS21_007212 [Conoideocrella luteorostrata]|uniref:Uncharacterized protein n=1 Tax=Conoideocrella luteorostrata TaxID=1105319 RepID=A0AAJ0CL59_9HYPO|nr:hypothetical protein QQS21_007212 [Conoideocrella luteorostrata]